MQFIFGDNRSRYDLLYTDDVREEAAKVLDLIRLPFELDESFDIYGFLPFGKNSNRPLYFRAKKDTKLSRNVYFLHGFYRELDTEYFFGNAYTGDMFTNFVEQDGFDALRDAPDSFSYDVTFDASLDLADVAELDITKTQMVKILEQLYQKNKVVILLDDERFEPVYTRLLMKKLFKYLPPSLRKICSYIIGMLDTGSMNFMITVIPKSMYKKTAAACIDLTAEDEAGAKVAVFTDFIELALSMSDGDRENLFAFFELVCYGRSATYQKQKFADFITNYAKGDYETMLSDFVESNFYTDETPIPPQISSVLAPYYANEEYLRTVLDPGNFDLYEPMRFYEDNATTLIKLAVLADPELAYVKDIVTAAYAVRLTGENIADIHTADEAFVASVPEQDDIDSAVESKYIAIICDAVAQIEQRIDNFHRFVSQKNIDKWCESVFEAFVDTPIPEERRESLIEQLVYAIISNEKIAEFIKANDIDVTRELIAGVIAAFDEHDRAAIETIRAREEAERAAEAAQKLAAIEDSFANLESLLDETLATVERKRENDEVDAETNEPAIAYRDALAESLQIDESFSQRRADCFVKHIIISTLIDDSYLKNMHSDSLLAALIEKDSGAMDKIIAGLIARGEMDYVVAAIMVIITYSTKVEAMIAAVAETVLGSVDCFKDLGRTETAEVLDYLAQALDQKIIQFDEGEELMLEVCDASIMKLEQNKMKNGFTKKLAEVLDDFLARLSPEDTESRPKINKNTLLIMIGGVALVLVLAIIILVVTLLPDNSNGGTDATDAGNDGTTEVVDDITTGSET